MRRIKLHEMEPPRLLTEIETAHLLGLGPSEFSRRVKELEERGLPKRDALFGKRDRKAIELWLDGLFGLAAAKGFGPGDIDVMARIERMG